MDLHWVDSASEFWIGSAHSQISMRVQVCNDKNGVRILSSNIFVAKFRDFEWLWSNASTFRPNPHHEKNPSWEVAHLQMTSNGTQPCTCRRWELFQLVVSLGKKMQWYTTFALVTFCRLETSIFLDSKIAFIQCMAKRFMEHSNCSCSSQPMDTELHKLRIHNT